MKLVAEKSTIVVAGSFNPTILTPQWVARYGLEYGPEQQFEVDMRAPVSGLGSARFSFEGLSYIAHFGGLNFFLSGLDAAGTARVAQVVHRILTNLPHTPVAGVGINFSFVSETPGALAELMPTSPTMNERFGETASVVKRKWGNSISMDEFIVNVDCEQTADKTDIDFNFHFEATGATHAARIFESHDCIERFKQQAIQAAIALTGEQLEIE